MPVGTNATVKALRPDELEKIGVKIILSNTYHLYLRPGREVVRAAGGLHRFMAWKGNILTDSGGFQVFSLSPFRRVEDGGVEFRSHVDGSLHKLTPELVVEIQCLDLGSDILMPLDVCTPSGVDRREAELAVTRTSLWATRSRDRWRELGCGELFGIVQGNFFPDLRRRSAAETVELDLPGYAVGGLSVGEETAVFSETLALTCEMLPADRPRYVMGVGTPEYILDAVGAGADMFDCVYPTRIARNALALTRKGDLNLRLARNRLDGSAIDDECGCYTCRSASRAYLRHLFKAKEILAAVLTTLHNLQFMQDLMVEIRASIREDGFTSFRNSYLERRRSRASA
jgi:queuine tRNA-ribosyltransferase